MFKHSIFFRIHAGLLFLVGLIALLSYMMVQLINYQRVQEYRESLTDGLSYVISQRVARQATEQQKQDWISDASDLLGYPIQYIRTDQVELSRAEKRRLSTQQAAVRYNAEQEMTTLIVGIPDDPQHYLYMVIEGTIGERQIKATPTFILDYLVYYPGQEKEYLQKIQKRFSYPAVIRPLADMGLDSEQIGRLRTDHTIILYQDNATVKGTTISVVAPMPGNMSDVLVLGPVPLFNWMPFQLAAGVTLLSLFLLSLGVYVLILPMRRKIGQVNHALNKMKTSDMTVRVPVDGSDEMATLASSYNNMSDHIQRLIEAQRELMRAVSHELRTPVARIRFGMEMLAEEDDYEYRLQQVEMIDKDIEALNTLIDEIMTYAKLEQGTPSLDIENIVLFEVLDQVVVETEALKTQKEIHLNAPPLTLKVEAERRYLHRVVQNLVGNAVRYGDHQVLVSGGINDSGMAYVCVEDDGPGIPEDERERVFEAFARLDDSRTRASGGYGLGLSIVSRIAYWFGGSVKVDQSPSLGGARFTMTWPAHRFSKSKKKYSVKDNTDSKS